MKTSAKLKLLPPEVLKNRQQLVKMSLQAIFEKSVRGVLKQWRQAVSGPSGACLNRTTNGLRCAAGQLLSDETVNYLGVGIIFNTVSEAFGINTKSNKHQLVRELQIAHDGYDPGSNEPFIRYFKTKAVKIAAMYNLDASFVQEYKENLNV